MLYSSWLPALLGFLTAVGPLSTDMYLPAFPAIEASLRGQPGTAQITLAAWFAGLAIGQVTQGSLADRYGRRRPLAAGLVLYTAASAGCALAPGIGTLCLCRFAAAFGGSAGMVIPRAMVRDLADGHAAARLMSRLMLVMGAAPILAPTLGGFVLRFATWHMIFWITAVYGALCCILVGSALPETLLPARRLRLSFMGTLGRLASVLRDRVFFSYALTSGFGMFGTFAYIGGSSPVFIKHFGFTPEQYGMLFGCSAFMYILSSQLNPRLVYRFGAAPVLQASLAMFVAAGVTLAALSFAGLGGPAGVVAPVMLAMASMGLVVPNTAVGALSRHAAQAGSASALIGTIQFSLAALSGVAVGALTDGTPRPMAAMVCAGALGAFAADRLRSRAKSGAPASKAIP